MGYKKRFITKITVFPDLYKDIYFDYTKQLLNLWITECFNSYTDRFTINVAQSSGIAQFYHYDNIETPGVDIDLRKLWSNPYSQYHIFIYGEGEISYGISPSIQPPKEIIAMPQSNIIFKYQESTKKDGIKMYLSGRGLGIPQEYSSNFYDTEDWHAGSIKAESVISDNWGISVNVNKDIFDSIYNLMNDLIDLSETNDFKFEMDEKIGNIEVFGKYLILNQDIKDKYFILCRKLISILLQDDTFEIEYMNMDFYSTNTKEFYIEKYFFAETNALLDVRHIKI